MNDDAERIDRVRAALTALGYSPEILVMPNSTHSAELAAAAANCDLGQIVKTLVVFAGEAPMLVLVPGDRRLSDRLLATRCDVGRKHAKLASPEQVLTLTGYPVGGVSPFGLPTRLPVLADAAFERFHDVWIAAGTANAILPMPLELLLRFTSGKIGVIAT